MQNFLETIACSSYHHTRNQLNVYAHLNLQINREHDVTDIFVQARHAVSSYWLFASRCVVIERERESENSYVIPYIRHMTTSKCRGCFVDRDYQFKELFFPHTYGFILLEDIDMQIRLSFIQDTYVLRTHKHIYHVAAGIRNNVCIASYGIVRFLVLSFKSTVVLKLKNTRSIRNMIYVNQKYRYFIFFFLSFFSPLIKQYSILTALDMKLLLMIDYCR